MERLATSALRVALAQPCYARGAVVDGLISHPVPPGAAARALLRAWGLTDTANPPPDPLPGSGVVTSPPTAPGSPAGRAARPASPARAGHGQGPVPAHAPAGQGAAPAAAAAAAKAAAAPGGAAGKGAAGGGGHGSGHSAAKARAPEYASPAPLAASTWEGHRRVYWVELTGGSSADAGSAAVPPPHERTSGSAQAPPGATAGAAQAGEADARPGARPPPEGAPHAAHTLCDELQRVHASMAASAAAPRSALVLRRAVGAASGGAPQAVHREVCGLAWALGELRTALPRAAADDALIPEPYTLQARPRARPGANAVPLHDPLVLICSSCQTVTSPVCHNEYLEAWPVTSTDLTTACTPSAHMHQLGSNARAVDACCGTQTGPDDFLFAPCRWSGGLRPGSPSAASSASSSLEVRATRTAQMPTAPPRRRRPPQGPPAAPARRSRRPTRAARPPAAGTSPPVVRRPCACASVPRTPAASKRPSPLRLDPGPPRADSPSAARGMTIVPCLARPVARAARMLAP